MQIVAYAKLIGVEQGRQCGVGLAVGQTGACKFDAFGFLAAKTLSRIGLSEPKMGFIYVEPNSMKKQKNSSCIPSPSYRRFLSGQSQRPVPEKARIEAASKRMSEKGQTGGWWIRGYASSHSSDFLYHAPLLPRELLIPECKLRIGPWNMEESKVCKEWKRSFDTPKVLSDVPWKKKK
ncbi:uncharacterized protein VTP21DRAFT_2506 [Calcarisporiella thermophila]|uniref:uncharacterized protein n=1 Tax=Calcarisporiella thermophila TaxID=911321 RepID=UPI003742D000